MGFSGGASGEKKKCLPTQETDVRDNGLIPGSEKFPGGRNCAPFQFFLPRESHGQKSLAGSSPWSHRVGHD